MLMMDCLDGGSQVALDTAINASEHTRSKFLFMDNAPLAHAWHMFPNCRVLYPSGTPLLASGCCAVPIAEHPQTVF